MSSNNHRILLHVLMPSGNDPEAKRKADATYYRINNVLMGEGQLPNIARICDYCDEVNVKLGTYIRNRCLDIGKKEVLFKPGVIKSNSMLNIIESSERKKIRILLYPGTRTDIDDLNMSDTTHNMIVQFDQNIKCFRSTDPHINPPSFYQTCNSADNALLYLEGLMVDACICHYLGVSDVALHHDDKQRISSEKVQFLIEFVKKQNMDFLTKIGQRLVKYVAAQLNNNTPYISFLSIFTIAAMDLIKDEHYDVKSYFEDYCFLWSEFQKWYFNRHGRVFTKNTEIVNPLETVFDRNKYQGQISPNEIIKRIEEKINTPSKKVLNAPFGEELRYAVIIVKHMPDGPSATKQFEALFSGQLHQAKWDIIYWGDIEKYDNIIFNLEVVPFMIIS